MSRYLLIISCSKRKKNIDSDIEAIKLYDGVVFRTIRKTILEHQFFELLDILIISAKYGLIKSTDKIRYYDELMTENKAKLLKPQVIEKIQKILRNNYNEIFINLGERYIPLIENIRNFTNPNTQIIYANGKIGERLKQTKKWLLKISKKSSYTYWKKFQVR